MFSDKTYENIKENILTNITKVDTREGSLVNDMVSPISLEIDSAYRDMEKLLSIMFLNNTNGEYLEKRASEYGILRKQGTKATGEVTFTGNSGTQIPKSTLVSTQNGLLYSTIADCSISDKQITVQVEAMNIGSKYNILAECINMLPVAIVGIQSVVNASGFNGGTDIETDEALLKRTIEQIQIPAASGNISDYKKWSIEVNGIGDARVFPLKNGNGTVSVMPITTDKEVPNQTLLEIVKDNIENKRPIGVNVSILTAEKVSVNVNATVKLKVGYKLEDIKVEYENLLKQYIKDSVFILSNVDYYKCLSLFYSVEGVDQVSAFTINGGSTNINLSDNQIQAIGTINIMEV